MKRSIEHGKRSGFATLGTGGLNFDSFPMRLLAKGNGRHWNPADIDLSQDARDFAAMTDDEKWWTCTLATQFLAGEESVTQDLQPFVAAMAAEGRMADEMYLTQFVYEEARHTEAFRRWFDAVGVTDDLHPYVERGEHYMQIFTKDLPESLHALAADPSPRNQIRASVTYNHVVEGTLALTGYFAWQKVCARRGILPGMQQIIKHIGDDERRHMAWGTFTCRRHVAADDSLWEAVDERMQELLVPAMGVVTETFELYEGDVPPFEMDMSLTGEGHAVLRALCDLAGDVADRLLAPLDDGQRDLLHDALRTVLGAARGRDRGQGRSGRRAPADDNRR